MLELRMSVGGLCFGLSVLTQLLTLGWDWHSEVSGSSLVARVKCSLAHYCVDL
jgi:hypothetical protein